MPQSENLGAKNTNRKHGIWLGLKAKYASFEVGPKNGVTSGLPCNPSWPRRRVNWALGGLWHGRAATRAHLRRTTPLPSAQEGLARSPAIPLNMPGPPFNMEGTWELHVGGPGHLCKNDWGGTRVPATPPKPPRAPPKGPSRAQKAPQHRA